MKQANAGGGGDFPQQTMEPASPPLSNWLPQSIVGSIVGPLLVLLIARKLRKPRK